MISRDYLMILFKLNIIKRFCYGQNQSISANGIMFFVIKIRCFLGHLSDWLKRKNFTIKKIDVIIHLRNKSFEVEECRFYAPYFYKVERDVGNATPTKDLFLFFEIIISLILMGNITKK